MPRHVRRRAPGPWPAARLKALVAEATTAEELAARLGMDRSNLGRILNGDTVPRIDTAAVILAALGRRWADLDDQAGGTT